MTLRAFAIVYSSWYFTAWRHTYVDILDLRVIYALQGSITVTQPILGITVHARQLSNNPDIEFY
jgi:hypothetical protein